MSRLPLFHPGLRLCRLVSAVRLRCLKARIIILARIITKTRRFEFAGIWSSFKVTASTTYTILYGAGSKLFPGTLAWPNRRPMNSTRCSLLIQLHSLYFKQRSTTALTIVHATDITLLARLCFSEDGGVERRGEGFSG